MICAVQVGYSDDVTPITVVLSPVERTCSTPGCNFTSPIPSRLELHRASRVRKSAASTYVHVDIARLVTAKRPMATPSADHDVHVHSFASSLGADGVIDDSDDADDDTTPSTRQRRRVLATAEDGEDIVYRNTYTVKDKVRLLMLYERLQKTGMSGRVAAAKMNVSYKTINAWVQPGTKAGLLASVSTMTAYEARATRTRVEKESRAVFRIEEQVVQGALLDMVKEGHCISARWIKTKLQVAIRGKAALLDTPEAYRAKVEGFAFSEKYIRGFVLRCHLAYRKTTNKKEMSLLERLPYLARYFIGTHDLIFDGDAVYGPHGEPVLWDPIYGRWMPEMRGNVDQCGASFDRGDSKGYVTKGSKRVWRASAHNAGKYRFVTAQMAVLCRAPGMPQPRLTLVFAGTGLRVSRAELRAHDSRVCVMWQRKAYVDDAVCKLWAKEEVPLILASLGYDAKIPPDMLWTFDGLAAHVR
jgi:hypothetical protein